LLKRNFFLRQKFFQNFLKKNKIFFASPSQYVIIKLYVAKHQQRREAMVVKKKAAKKKVAKKKVVKKVAKKKVAKKKVAKKKK
ncbi:MAG TPA: hypothetical protein P5246_02190, partial [Candidatus Omnitrophota bacterium]|nr:hypothetical protein [Candidatus Omnitrophota bacterium]